jgi:hypothetical protein
MIFYRYCSRVSNTFNFTQILLLFLTQKVVDGHSNHKEEIEFEGIWA